MTTLEERKSLRYGRIAAGCVLFSAPMLWLWVGLRPAGAPSGVTDWAFLLAEVIFLICAARAIHDAGGELRRRMLGGMGLILAVQLGGVLFWLLNYSGNFARTPVCFLQGWAELQFVCAVGALILMRDGVPLRSERRARLLQIAPLLLLGGVVLDETLAGYFAGGLFAVLGPWWTVIRLAALLWLGAAVTVAPRTRKWVLLLTPWGAMMISLLLEYAVQYGVLWKCEPRYIWIFGLAGSFFLAAFWFFGAWVAWRADGGVELWSPKVCRRWLWAGLCLLLLATVQSFGPVIFSRTVGGEPTGAVFMPLNSLSVMLAWIACGVGWGRMTRRERLLLGGMAALFWLSRSELAVFAVGLAGRRSGLYPALIQLFAVAGTMGMLWYWQRNAAPPAERREIS